MNNYKQNFFQYYFAQIKRCFQTLKIQHSLKFSFTQIVIDLSKASINSGNKKIEALVNDIKCKIRHRKNRFWVQIDVIFLEFQEIYL